MPKGEEVALNTDSFVDAEDRFYDQRQRRLLNEENQHDMPGILIKAWNDDAQEMDMVSLSAVISKGTTRPSLMSIHKSLHQKLQVACLVPT